MQNYNNPGVHARWFIYPEVNKLSHACPVLCCTWVFCYFGPCARVYCLAPPILLSDYWLIRPTCLSRYPPLFVPLFSLLVFVVLCWFVVRVSCSWSL